MDQRMLAALLAAACLALPGALHAQTKPKAEKPVAPDEKVLQEVFTAFGGGLPKEWQRAWVVVSEVRDKGGERIFDVKCLYREAGGKPEDKVIPTCDRRKVFENVWSLNKNIPAGEKRRWKTATLEFMADGKFALKYEYDEPAKPKPEAKKDAKKN